MNLRLSTRLVGLIVFIWLLAVIVSISVVPRLPWRLPTWLPWAVAILLSTISAVADLVGLFGQTTDKIPATKEDVDNLIGAHLESLYRHLKLSPPRITQRFPGFSCHMIVSLHKLRDTRRKFLLDVGHSEKNRVSIYLDSANFLCLRLINLQGEIQTVKVPPGESTFEFDKVVYIMGEIGDKGHSSFLRLLLDGNEVATQEMPYALELSLLDVTNASLGADLQGNYGGYFDMAEIAIYSNTLTTDDTEKLLDYFREQERNRWLVFSGVQRMTIRDLEQ